MAFREECIDKTATRHEDLDNIITTLQQFSEIEKAVIFGSRVKGNYKPGSDVDIAIWGNDISFSTLSGFMPS